MAKLTSEIPGRAQGRAGHLVQLVLIALLLTGCQTNSLRTAAARPAASGHTPPAPTGATHPPAFFLPPAATAAVASSATLATAPERPVSLARGAPFDVVKLRPGLVVNMTVLVAGKKEIDETAKRISDKGTMVLPLLGTLEVKDSSLEELSLKLTDLYRKYYVNPQVIVEFVRDANAEGISPWGYVTVLGRVKNPGRIALPATRDLTVSGGIQKAGGFNTSAKSDSILVTRRGPDGKSVTREIDLNAVGADGRMEDDVVVEADDVVFVPESRF